MPNLQQNLQIIIEQLRNIVDDLETLNNKPLHVEFPVTYTFIVTMNPNYSHCYAGLTFEAVREAIKHYHGVEHSKMKAIIETTDQERPITDFLY